VKDLQSVILARCPSVRSALGAFLPRTSLCLCLVLCAGWAKSAGTFQENETTSNVSGRVIHAETGIGIAGARVVLTTAQGVTVASVSDAAGTFSIEGLSPGGVRLSAELDGYYRPKDSGGPVQFTLGPGQAIAGIVVRLAPGLSVSGSVTDDEGRSVSGAEVVAVLEGFDRRGRPVRQLCQGVGGLGEGHREVTDEDGAYRLYGLEPGTYFLAVGGCGFESLPQFYPGTSDPALALPVVLTAGLDLAGINLTLAVPERFPVTFRVEPPLQARRGAIPMYQLVRRSPAGLLTFFYSGGPLGRPFASGPGGDWTSPPLPEGAYSFYMSTDWSSFRGGEVAFDLFDGERDLGTVVFREPAVLSGRLRFEGMGSLDLSDLRLRFQSVDGLATLFGAPLARVGSDGSFSASLPAEGARRGVLAAGTYEIEVLGLPEEVFLGSARLGAQDALANGLFLEGAANPALDLVLDAPGGIVDGIVLSRSVAATDARVVLVPSARHRGNSTLYRTAWTDQNGRFEIRGILPEDYQVFAWESVEENAWLNADFRRPLETRAVRVTIEKGERETLELEVIPAQ
jgi:Carboxypeptidase regulatory-like domain